MEDNNSKQPAHPPGPSFLAMTMVSACLLVVVLLLKIISGSEIEPVDEPVYSGPLPEDPLSLSQAPEGNLHIVPISKGDTLTGILLNNRVDETDLLAITSMPAAKQNLVNLQPGKTLTFRLNDKRQVLELSYPLSASADLIIDRADDGFTTHVDRQPLQQQIVHAAEVISGSLYEAGEKAKLPSKITMQLANIFNWKIDFSKDIRPGDSFNLLYTDYYRDGKKVQTGDILVAEFTNRGETYRVVRFEYPKDHVGYYTMDGENVQKAFLRVPIHYKRVSSSFNPRRMHPVLKTRRPHLGVDLAAPYGTPIKAVGSGTVTFAGRKGGYGNVIILNNGHSISTRYAHMQKFAKGIKRGKRVKKGQVIGYVGSTGLATGPHLHYEFRIDGRPYNPLTIKLPQAQPIPSDYQKAFFNQSNKLVAELERQPTTQMVATSADANRG
tara:strand:+ start:1494 stop:2810 length:1317 start_codon:yes stop_codon:yes gene_type:complete